VTGRLVVDRRDGGLHLVLANLALPQVSRQADGLAGQVGAGQFGAAAAGVALVEQQVQDVLHQAQAFGALVGRRKRERLVRRLEFGLGPADALSPGRFGNQERGGDLALRAGGPQCSRRWSHLGVGGAEHLAHLDVPGERRPDGAAHPDVEAATGFSTWRR